jgi:hypothetical protein
MSYTIFSVACPFKKLVPFVPLSLCLVCRLYQMSHKFRDELRPRFGMIRANEFCMKDLYTFDRDLEAAQHTYAEVRTCICVSVPFGFFTYFNPDPPRIEAYLIIFGNKIACWSLKCMQICHLNKVLKFTCLI